MIPIISQVLEIGDPNPVSAALLLANLCGEDPIYAPMLGKNLHLIVGVVAASLEDTEFRGRAWSPKGACQVGIYPRDLTTQALSCMSLLPDHQHSLVHLNAAARLASVLRRNWATRDNYVSLGGRYFADAQGYAARSLWNMRSLVCAGLLAHCIT